MNIETSPSTSVAKADPQGIGGWLILPVAGFLVIGPIASVLSDYSELNMAEFMHPGLSDSAAWGVFKFWIVALSLGMAAFSVYVGYKLKNEYRPQTVTLVKAGLWIAGPGKLVLASLLALMSFGRVDPSVFGYLIFACIFAWLWTMYFSRSKRVKKTYGSA